MLTTIAISPSTKNKLIEFKMPGETYDDLLLRFYKSASERQLQDLLMDSTDCISIDEALKIAKNKWEK